MVGLLLGGLLPSRTVAEAGSEPAAGLDQAIAAAEASLREGERETAESHYRAVLLEGWLLMGALETVEERLAEARNAFRNASVSAVETRRALQSLALVQLAMGEAAPAVEILTRLAGRNPKDVQVRRLLAQALVAERLSARGAEAAGREPNRHQEPDRHQEDALDPEAGKTAVTPEIEAAALSPQERLTLKGRVRADLARTYLNLGVMQVQRERFARAAELFERAAAVDPEFPQVQYSLGVAHFNARQFDKAAGPLARALAANPQEAGLRRMLAMALFNTEVYGRAAELLRDDPERDADPSLQFAFGLALVRSDQAAEAEKVFARLLARHGDSAEVRVMLGQAHAQQGDFESAIESLTRALQLKADAAEANGTLGIIYLKQGRLAEAEQALQAELAGHAGDVKSQNALATVLDLEGRPEEALRLLRQLLKVKPDFANARYLLGKILLAQGAAPEAVENLEAAVRLTPEDANIHYQLGRAYQQLGRTEEARQEFEVFRQLKDKRRKSAP
jgi:tetratricopeptide (TPR) repeat protein